MILGLKKLLSDSMNRIVGRLKHIFPVGQKIIFLTIFYYSIATYELILAQFLRLI